MHYFISIDEKKTKLKAHALKIAIEDLTGEASTKGVKSTLTKRSNLNLPQEPDPSRRNVIVNLVLS